MAGHPSAVLLILHGRYELKHTGAAWKVNYKNSSCDLSNLRFDVVMMRRTIDVSHQTWRNDAGRQGNRDRLP